MNTNHEEEELKPYSEPEPDFSDPDRIGLLCSWLPSLLGSLCPTLIPQPHLFSAVHVDVEKETFSVSYFKSERVEVHLQIVKCCLVLVYLCTNFIN